MGKNANPISVLSKALKNNLQLIQSLGIIIATVVSLVGIFISLNQLSNTNQQIKKNSVKYSADVILYLDNELNISTNKGIKLAIENKDSVLINNGGKYTKEDLERYLDIFETLNDFYYSDLITERMVCVNFSVLISDTYKNKEVKEYVAESRIEYNDNTIYQGLVDLYSEMQEFEGKECPEK